MRSVILYIYRSIKVVPDIYRHHVEATGEISSVHQSFGFRIIEMIMIQLSNLNETMERHLFKLLTKAKTVGRLESVSHKGSGLFR